MRVSVRRKIFMPGTRFLLGVYTWSQDLPWVCLVADAFYGAMYTWWEVPSRGWWVSLVRGALEDEYTRRWVRQRD